ncbi:MAG: DNA adenine methylase [Bacteroidales bacterium]|nr:DNA adenine methylase [Bacteroidales bacterium]
MKPFLKWAGGKRQLMPFISEFINKNSVSNKRYFEPFIGGGSVFFNLQCPKATICDLNEEIINCYNVIKENSDELIVLLKKHKKNHCKEYFYKIRELDRKPNIFNKLTNVEKAARTIYLNRTCYNGLYRVNLSGYFNTPLGKYVNPMICDEENIKEVSKFLNKKGIEILCADFEKAVEKARAGDWVYFDPPYDYQTEGFVNYNKEGFNHDDLKRLKKLCDKLIKRGVNVLISNNDTKFVRATFKSSNYQIIYSTKVIKANRNINSKGEKRKKVDEVLIYGRKA